MLKRCPFCGSKARYSKDVFPNQEQIIECKNKKCGVSLYVGENDIDIKHLLMREARKRWNRRIVNKTILKGIVLSENKK